MLCKMDWKWAKKRNVLTSELAAVAISAIVTWFYTIKNDVVRLELMGQIFFTCAALLFMIFMIGTVVYDQYKHSH